MHRRDDQQRRKDRAKDREVREFRTQIGRLRPAVRENRKRGVNATEAEAEQHLPTLGVDAADEEIMRVACDDHTRKSEGAIELPPVAFLLSHHDLNLTRATA